MDVFERMPPEDRDTIIAVLEREVDMRNLSRIDLLDESD